MNTKRTLFWVTLFAIAMGFMETAVVVYLRKLYYSGEFKFPLVPIEPQVAQTEFWREAATIVMLAAIGVFCGRSKSTRFAWFIYAFAIWDLFYYLFLKIILNWPESLNTWDILFLIPVPWVGPVIAPCILSLNMILLALIILFREEKRQCTNPGKRVWLLLIVGAIICILSFCYDYLFQVVASGNNWDPLLRKNLFENIKTYIPGQFNWLLFGVGESLVLIATLLFRYKSRFEAIIPAKSYSSNK